ncbi:MAG: type II toxin-antitoxin system RelB/DinJ family antitoxin [Campylobacterales bacterium]
MRQTTSMKLDPQAKAEAKEVLSALGLTLSEAVNLFLHQVKLRQGIPFEIELPNKKTQKIMKEVRQGRHVEAFDPDELKRA